MARQADHADVVAEILAAELGADAQFPRPASSSASSSRSRKAWPVSLPAVGRPSR
jgi:hypothetical protein